MGARFSIHPIAQPNWSACWYTALFMLDEWRRVRQGMSLFGQVTDFANVVYAPGKFASQSENLFNRANIGAFLLQYGFISRTIEMKPEAFEAQLRQGKPFAYVAEAGNGYQHTLVITGIDKHRDIYRIFYVDPNGGLAKNMEFFAFAGKHPPAWGDKAFVVFPH